MRTDDDTVILKKNFHLPKNRHVIDVLSTMTLKPHGWVNDTILNFIWHQFACHHVSLYKDLLKMTFFPSYFLTKLCDKDRYNYNGVRKWSSKFLGADKSPLDFDVILFLRNTGDHQFIYVMFPKHKHLEAMGSLGYNRCYLPDFTNLWRWLNDNLHYHWGLQEPLDRSQWVFWMKRNQSVVPGQRNGWDCGLYATHYGFCLGSQASFSDMTPERIDLYRKRLILYMLDGSPESNILMPQLSWCDSYLIESPLSQLIAGGYTT
jgi:Ulp1 family protease